jgi:hypothetical protein
MSRLADLQRAFADALLDVNAAVPATLSRKVGGVPTRRFGVYRNNVYASLIDVLAGRFAVVSRLVGEEFFRAMARDYVEGEPPGSAVLIRYGASFPAFVAGFPPAASVPYLGDIASLEWAWHAAYHAEDAAPMPLTDLARAVERAEDVRLALHPSLGVVRSLYPIVSIFEMNNRSDEVPATRLEGREDALVLRPRLDVDVRRLPQGGAPFVLALKENKTLGEAAAAAIEEAPSFVLETMLAGLIGGGAIISIGPVADPKL